MITNRHTGHINRKVEICHFFSRHKTYISSFSKTGIVVNVIFHPYQVGSIGSSNNRFLVKSADVGMAPIASSIYKAGIYFVKACVETGYISNKTQVRQVNAWCY